jgi:hypothetical protein
MTAQIITPITPLEAAKRMMAKRGYVVIGYKAGREPDAIREGYVTVNFAGHYLEDGYALCVTGPSNRQEWDEQMIAIHGNKKRNKGRSVKHATFWRAALV